MTGITHLNNAAMGLEANREPGVLGPGITHIILGTHDTRDGIKL